MIVFHELNVWKVYNLQISAKLKQNINLLGIEIYDKILPYDTSWISILLLFLNKNGRL